MIPTVTTRGPIGRTLSAICRELVRLRVQKTKDFTSNETPRGTILNLAPPKTITEGPTQGPRYQPFISEGSTRYWITPWHYGFVGPVISVGDRQYRGFQLTGGNKVIVATVKLKAYATRNPAEDYDPENMDPVTYGVLNSLILVESQSSSFQGDQTAFGLNVAQRGIPIISQDPWVGFFTQSWFFPVKLTTQWNEMSTRISADDVVATGTRQIPLEEGQEDNPWIPTGFFKEYEHDILVGYLHQTGTSGSTSGYALDLIREDYTSFPAVPESTEITGDKTGINDQAFPYWHAELKLVPNAVVPICDPAEGGPYTTPWEPYGFTLRNRDENGYPPGSDYPGKDESNPLRNEYPRQLAFMLPFSQGVNYIPSSRGLMDINDQREDPPSCL